MKKILLITAMLCMAGCAVRPKPPMPTGEFYPVNPETIQLDRHLDNPPFRKE